MTRDRIWTLSARKLSGEATQSELAELNDLIKAYPDAEMPARLLEELWNEPNEKDIDYLEATYQLHLNRLEKKGITVQADESLINNEYPGLPFKTSNKKAIKQVLFATLVTGCLLFAGALFFINKKNTLAFKENQHNTLPAESEVSTKSGSRTKIQLPDGTTVWLNGNSKLVYSNQHFGETLREVTLVGEGYFDVVKNHDKPFIIHTAKMDIKVVGTAFNVKCYPGEKTTETSLIRGSIEVALKNREQKIVLKPSDKLVITNEGGTAESAAGNENASSSQTNNSIPIITLSHLTHMAIDSAIVETAWVENKLLFSSETFEEVALKMEKWYGTHISFANKKLKTEKLTGSFEKETVNEALRALQFTTHFKYTITNDTIIISN